MSKVVLDKTKVKPLKSPEEGSLDLLLPHNCLFYILPPLIDVSLKDFEGKITKSRCLKYLHSLFL